MSFTFRPFTFLLLLRPLPFLKIGIVSVKYLLYSPLAPAPSPTPALVFDFCTVYETVTIIAALIMKTY